MIPTVDDLKSAPLRHSFGDLFNPPGLTNFIGCVQAAIDVTGISCLNFPPFATSVTLTGALTIDERLFRSMGAQTTFTWYPDRIVRDSVVRGLHIRSVTALALGRTAAVMHVEIENRDGVSRDLSIGLALQGGVARVMRPWNAPHPPSEQDNEVAVDSGRGALVFSARESSAVSVQGTWPAADVTGERRVTFRRHLKPGQSFSFSYVNAIGETRAEATQTFDVLAPRVGEELRRVRADWNDELAAIFTPGNDRYGGHLPVLQTDDADIRKLYWMGALGVVYFKRDSPHSVFGRAYDTLMPRYWQSVTFIWDYMLSSQVHAMLDPTVMRGYLERWMRMDIYHHFGTEYLTGGPVGNWYSINDSAMVRLAYEYIRWTGDREWLNTTVAETGRSVSDFLVDFARHWKSLRGPSGLADYGGILNLLECVSTYLHEVASLNAANVWSMRTLADLLDAVGPGEVAAELRSDAAALLGALRARYVAGRGYWRTRFPDGTHHDVRHCLDLLTVLNTIPDDLSDEHKAEMVDFFRRELQTETWMHALSPGDSDAVFDVRPDHQWTGAYPAWPPETVRGLYRIGETDLAFAWLKGLARSANQGPFGQAHFADGVVLPEQGGAAKCPPTIPYWTDWCCSSNGSWVTAVVEGIFGVQASVKNGISASPNFGSFDASASLINIPYQGKRYTATIDGIQEAE
jgi:hypothetical protein